MFESGNAEVHRLSRGRPRLAPDIRKNLIAEVALRLFAEIGFAETTMELIATRCAISKATLYTVFANKRELFTTLVEASIRLEIPEDDATDIPIAKQLETILLPDHPENEGEPGDRGALLQIICSQAYGHPELWDIYRAASSGEARRLTEWLLKQQSRGRLVFDDAEMIAQMLMNVVLGYPQSQSPTPDGGATRVPYMREFVTIFCRGIAAD